MNIKLYRYMLGIRERTLRFFTRDLQQKVAYKKAYQQNAYNELKQFFMPLYEKISANNIDKFVTPHWEKYNHILEKQFLPFPAFSFLRNPIIMFTMFATRGGSVMNNQINYLKKRVNIKKLRSLLQEDYVGKPLIMDKEFLTSHNTIDNLYHLIKYREITGYRLKKAKCIIEWGGGYGNMAKIVRKINSSCTYILIDTPLQCCLQWLYLSSILGREKINLITDKRAVIREARINIFPLSFLETHNFRADFFISTWALSESSHFAQNYVFEQEYFQAKHILLAYQKSNKNLPYASRVGMLIKRKGGIVRKIEIMPDNYYGFR